MLNMWAAEVQCILQGGEMILWKAWRNCWLWMEDMNQQNVPASLSLTKEQPELPFQHLKQCEWGKEWPQDWV
jgi:hypothetical protein